MKLVQSRAISRSGVQHVQPTIGPCSNDRLCRAPLKVLVSPESGELVTTLSTYLDHLPLAYEPVALPCSIQKCGDVVHRSTLDPVLRKEVTGLDWRGLALLASVGIYLSVPPGVLPGFLDYYFIGPLQRALNNKAYGKDSIIMGKKLATGGFGTVYRAELKQDDGQIIPVIVKRAKEFGEAEVWMNERMMRVDPLACANFITAFDDKSLPGNKPTVLDNSVWLVWTYEGNYTLADLMQKKDFPYNLEPMLFKRELRLPKGPLRKLVSYRLVMKQLLEALKSCHQTGIVHRDVKPQNCILSEKDKKVKLIDLGAAADLRVGINYVPNEYLLDPRYAPPQQYVMSTQTPRPPPKPVAALLSPMLWLLNAPDRFDMYSCGVMLLQLAFPNLRSDNNLIAFNRKLESYNYDLRKWRRDEEKKNPSKELLEGFELLDAEGGSGWDLVCQLVTYKPSDRLSAADALAHPWLAGAAASGTAVSDVLTPVTQVTSQMTKAVGTVIANNDLVEVALKSVNADGLTEAELARELGYQEMPMVAPEGRQTIAWWQQRQEEMSRRIQDRQSRLSGAFKKTIAGVAGRMKPGDRSKPWTGFFTGLVRAQVKLQGGEDEGSPVAVNGNGKNGNGKKGNGRGMNGNGKGQQEGSAKVRKQVEAKEGSAKIRKVGETKESSQPTGSMSKVAELVGLFKK